MPKCLICQLREATKTNSHIIPSFLIAMVASYDQSYKRGRELMFTITPHQSKVYTGDLPDTKLEEIFDMGELTEERIGEELSKNTVALDYIFCPECEAKLSKYLETPYATKLQKNSNIQPVISTFFWLSVVWRMSVTGSSGFKLPSDIEKKLHESLKTFFELKDTGGDLSELIDKVNFNYRILHCKDYCKENAGYLYCKYDKINNVLTISIGDISICISFDKRDLQEEFRFFSLESYFQKAKVKTISDEEFALNVPKANYMASIKEFVGHAARIRKSEDCKLLDELWKANGRIGYMPIRLKVPFLQILYTDGVKLGERYSNKRFVDIFNFLVKNFWIWC